MFDSGVFSPFLGLSTDAPALNFHAIVSRLVCMGDGGLPACRVSGARGPRILCCSSQAGWVWGAGIWGRSILSP